MRRNIGATRGIRFPPRPGRVWWNGLLLFMGLVLLCRERPAFSDRLGDFHRLRVFSHHAGTAATARCARRAGCYLAASHAGTLCLFAFFALLAARTGSWELGPMRDHPELAPLFWLALGGLWPEGGHFSAAHLAALGARQRAEPRFGACSPGVTHQNGHLRLVRFSGWLPVPAAAGWTVAALGVVSAVLGVVVRAGAA